MENTVQDMERLMREFQQCQKMLIALGDETRQYLIGVMLGGNCKGNRVIEISQRTNLSRPAVSHHMQILKDTGIVKSRKEGTRVYYYLDPQDRELDQMIALFTDIKRMMERVSDRSGDETD